MKCLKNQWLNAGVAPVALVEERPASAWGLRSVLKAFGRLQLKLRRAKGLEERLDEP